MADGGGVDRSVERGCQGSREEAHCAQHGEGDLVAAACDLLVTGGAPAT